MNIRYLCVVLKMNSHPHDAHFIDSTLERMPFRFRKPITRRYSRTYQQKGRRDANLFLLDTLDKMPDSVAVRLAGSDYEVVRFAEDKANQAAIAAAKLGQAALAPLSEAARAFGIVPPEPGGDITHGSALERLQDPLWWRRAIRKTQGRKVEAAARNVGLVHKGSGIYSSDETLYRRDEQKSRNRLMLEEMIAINELGQEYTLAELSDLSVSNPVIRRGELMTRIAGFEQVANDLKHRALFITLTCPSRFHSHTIRNKKSMENPHYDGSTPRDAQAYLQKIWTRIRSKLARHGITLYGFRVAEPNHDGCVHWHILTFSARWATRRVRRTIREHALRDSPNEPGAKKHRVTFVEIDPAKGSAAGYIAKYIAKNIDGHALDQDLFGGDPIEAAARVDAWASCWGIRQFQQLGGPPVTVWRELRRIDGEESGILETARDAADRGDWAEFVRAMGGPTCPRSAQPVRLAKATDLIDINENTGEVLRASPVVNKYGEPAAAQIVGVACDGQITATRWHVWELVRDGTKNVCGWPADVGIQKHTANAAVSGIRAEYVAGIGDSLHVFGKAAGHAAGVCPEDREKAFFGGVPHFEGWCEGDQSTALSGAHAPPWSSVNNCTRHSREGEKKSGYYKSNEFNHDPGEAGRDPDSHVHEGRQRWKDHGPGDR